MSTEGFNQILEQLPGWRDQLAASRDLLLSNAVMIGEIPSGTYHEQARVKFIQDRFVESGVQDYSSDEADNVIAVLPGAAEEPGNILIATHLDNVFDSKVDHTVSLQADTISGPGIADNALGVAAMITLPDFIKALGLTFQDNLILLGASRSLGRGNLEGVRFFLQNSNLPLRAGVCLEGVRLGRLNCASIGMLRGEFKCEVPEEYDWTRFGASGAIVTLNETINRIMEIPLPKRPRTSVVFGSISGGSGYSVAPRQSTLRFEIRSESAETVEDIRQRFHDIADEVAAQTRGKLTVDIFAERVPGGIHYSHPLVQCAHDVMERLDVSPRRGPSTAELAALIDHQIPAITVGLTNCENLNELDEHVEIAPMFTGLAQFIGILQAIDGGFCDES